MAEQPHIIVEAATPIDKKFGTRNDGNLRSAFPSSPLFNGDLTDKERKESYEDLALNGEVHGGNGLNSFSRDYTGNTQDPVPNLEDVETGGGGLPSSPYTPNLASPGPGSLSATDQPEFNGTLPDPENSVEFGSGLGGLVSPDVTSQKISETKIGDYISGRSFLGSGG